MQVNYILTLNWKSKNVFAEQFLQSNLLLLFMVRKFLEAYFFRNIKSTGKLDN